MSGPAKKRPLRPMDAEEGPRPIEHQPAAAGQLQALTRALPQRLEHDSAFGLRDGGRARIHVSILDARQRDFKARIPHHRRWRK